MNMAYVLGLICGIGMGIIVLFIILKLTKTDGRIKCKYDERQKIARGKAYAIAFWTLVGYNGLYGIYSAFTKKVVVEPVCGLTIGICIAAVVQISYCIWQDAYFSLNEDKKKLFLTFSVLGCANIVIGIITLIDGKWFEDGVLTIRCLNMVVGFLFIVIGIVYFVKKACSKNEME